MNNTLSSDVVGLPSAVGTAAVTIRREVKVQNMVHALSLALDAAAEGGFRQEVDAIALVYQQALTVRAQVLGGGVPPPPLINARHSDRERLVVDHEQDGQ